WSLGTWWADMAVLWDLQTRLPRATLQHPANRIGRVVWSPDGVTVATLSQEAIVLWDSQTGRLRKRLQGAGSCLSWSPDGKLLATGTDRLQAPGILLWDTATARRVPGPVEEPADVRSVAWSPNGE